MQGIYNFIVEFALILQQACLNLTSYRAAGKIQLWWFMTAK